MMEAHDTFHLPTYRKILILPRTSSPKKVFQNNRQFEKPHYGSSDGRRQAAFIESHSGKHEIDTQIWKYLRRCCLIRTNSGKKAPNGRCCQVSPPDTTCAVVKNTALLASLAVYRWALAETIAAFMFFFGTRNLG